MATCWPCINGDTPLHSAIRRFKGDIIPVKLLLEHDGSDVNVGNSEGETSLHLAVRSKSLTTVELVELLLGYGADVNVVNAKGETPLHLAVRNEIPLRKLIKLLLEDGADVKAKTPLDGNTALHWAATMHDYHPKEHSSIVNFLVKHGSDVNARNLKGDTPLHLAVLNKKEHPPIHDLLYNGADVDATNFKGDTPLRSCLRESGSDTFILYLRALLKRTKDINAVDSKGETLLHLAVRNEACAKALFIKMLLDHGADVSRKDATGKNAYQAYCDAVAKDFGRKEDPMLRILLQSKERQLVNSSLHVACLLHNVDSVQKLLRAGAYVNDKRGFGHPPLFYALIADPVDIDRPDDKFSTVRLMLHYGADLDHKFYRPDAPMLNYVFFKYLDYRTSLETLLYSGTVLGWAHQLGTDAMQAICDEHRTKILALQEKRVETGSNVKLLNKCNRDYIDKNYGDWLTLCSEELKAMSETKVLMGESGVSFLDVLLASKKDTKIYAENEELLEAIRAKSDAFPIYRGTLNTKLAKELERRKRACCARGLFSKIFRLFQGGPSFIEQNKKIKYNEDKMFH